MEVWGGNRATFSNFEKAGIDIWLYSRPCGDDSQGGDLYYLSSCASGRITRMVLADVAGHGEGVAHVATGLRRLMHRYINSIKPQRLFTEVNEKFTRATSDRFATSIVASYFMPTSTLSICNAGHPTPLLRRADGDHWGELEIPDLDDDEAGDFPLGIEEVSSYSQLDIRMRTGDMVFCYTDGVIESSSPGGEMLGVAGLQTMLNAASDLDADVILPHSVDRRTANDAHSLQQDDVTMLLCRVSDRPVPMVDNVAAPFRWVKGMLGPSR